MPPTIVIPTTQEWAQIEADRAKNSPLAVFNAYQAAKNGTAPSTAPGTGGAVTAAAGTNTNLNNLSNPDWIKAMSDMITQINIDAQQKANAARIPNATGLEQKSSANIGSALAGEVPNDVYREMAQRSAERGVATGNPMGANSTADIMRALGLTSLDLQNTGQTWLNNALARNPGATPANTQALVTTPAQAEALALQRQNMELDYLAKMAAINEAKQRSRSGYGGGGTGYRLPTGGTGTGTFAPATNWNTGTPIAGGWSDPGNSANLISDAEWNDMLYGYPGADLTPSGSPPANTYYNPTTNTSDYNPFGTYFTSSGGIDQGGMTQDELDWLYNVGG